MRNKDDKAKDAKARRLADALRANLRRRKEQSRAQQKTTPRRKATIQPQEPG